MNIPTITDEESRVCLLENLDDAVSDAVCDFFGELNSEDENLSDSISVRVFDDSYYFISEDGTWGSAKGLQIVPFDDGRITDLLDAQR